MLRAFIAQTFLLSYFNIFNAVLLHKFSYVIEPIILFPLLDEHFSLPRVFFNYNKKKHGNHTQVLQTTPITDWLFLSS